jgi:hypothetical protein
MASPALALPALSAFFSVATCDTRCGRKPQNQYLIRLPAPIDNGKSLLLLLINNAPVRRDMKTARDMPIFLFTEFSYVKSAGRKPLNQ